MALAEKPRFLQALKKEKTDQIPIWFMRQAGRYMECYRKLREKHALLELVKNPSLACEITLQPIDAFDLDAAIIFADILPLLECIGQEVTFTPKDGPKISKVLRHENDFKSISHHSLDEVVAPTLEAIRLVRHELQSRGTPLIGFSGAPFTLASYAITGSSSSNHFEAKQLMFKRPDLWHQLMATLSKIVGRYLAMQAKAGAQCLQLFDSWAGALSPHAYREHVFPYVKESIEIANTSNVPLIYFSTGTSAFMEIIAELPCTGISVDWRSSLTSVRQKIGEDRVLQGNLDPMALFCEPNELNKQVNHVLLDAQRAGLTGYIFNIGHGIHKETSEDAIKQVIEQVRNFPTGA